MGSECRRLGLGLCSQKAEEQLPFQEAGEKQTLCKDSGCSGGTEDTAERKISVPHPHDPYVSWDSEQVSLQKELSRASSAMTRNAPLTFPSSWGKVPARLSCWPWDREDGEGDSGKEFQAVGQEGEGPTRAKGKSDLSGPSGIWGFWTVLGSRQRYYFVTQNFGPSINLEEGSKSTF